MSTRSRLAIVVLLGFPLLAAATSCSAPAEEDEPATPAPGIPLEAVPAADATPAAQEVEDEAPRFTTEAREPIVEAFASTDALCRTFVARARSALTERVSHMSEKDFKAGTPSCHVDRRGPAFVPDATYLSLQSVRTFDGVLAQSLLVVETSRGFVLTSIGWDRNDPEDPGCGSIVREEEIERAYVENGHLVVTLLGSRSAYVEPTENDDDGYRPSMVKVASWCKDDGSALRCNDLNANYGVFLGTKIAPKRDWDKAIDWSRIPWRDETAFTIDERGELRVTRAL